VYVVGARDATHSGAHITLHTDYIHIVFAHKMCILIKTCVRVVCVRGIFIGSFFAHLGSYTHLL